MPVFGFRFGKGPKECLAGSTPSRAWDASRDRGTAGSARSRVCSVFFPHQYPRQCPTGRRYGNVRQDCSSRKLPSKYTWCTVVYQNPNGWRTDSCRSSCALIHGAVKECDTPLTSSGETRCRCLLQHIARDGLLALSTAVPLWPLEFDIYHYISRSKRYSRPGYSRDYNIHLMLTS